MCYLFNKKTKLNQNVKAVCGKNYILTVWIKQESRGLMAGGWIMWV